MVQVMVRCLLSASMLSSPFVTATTVQNRQPACASGTWSTQCTLEAGVLRVLEQIVVRVRIWHPRGL
eukprot:12938465-Prorocentrum_lima.AAC.1